MEAIKKSNRISAHSRRSEAILDTVAVELGFNKQALRKVWERESYMIPFCPLGGRVSGDFVTLKGKILTYSDVISGKQTSPRWGLVQFGKSTLSDIRKKKKLPCLESQQSFAAMIFDSSQVDEYVELLNIYYKLGLTNFEKIKSRRDSEILSAGSIMAYHLGQFNNLDGKIRVNQGDLKGNLDVQEIGRIIIS